MFINIKILKQLMKTTYKSAGLILAQTEDRYYIAGSRWEMDVKKKYIPKQIIDLAGEVPEIGTRKKYYRLNGKDECCDSDGALTIEPREYVEAEVTNLLLIDAFGIANRVLQVVDHLEIVNNAFILIADPASVDQDNESSISGPFFEGTSILWETNQARFRAYKREDKKHERLLRELSMIDLSEDPE
ncbi:hypothetical protein DXA98_10455 [Lachnospiraceae bacterium OF09-6]|nr:hypothetical protein DXA98_10455 [Lachnospiraceae bacterium OF09-6]